jgi:hypothetical protein
MLGGKRKLRHKSDVQIISILEMADRMIVMSEQGFVCCDDDGCLLLNGMVRECAYRLRDAAELERKVHQIKAKGGAVRGEMDRKGPVASHVKPVASKGVWQDVEFVPQIVEKMPG